MQLPKTPEQALEFLEAFSPSQIRLGLERIEHALALLDHPERRFRIVHVAGTNGKGSTCAFIASCLVSAGFRVGLYTSPHLVRINERFRIDREDISDELLGKRVLEVVQRYPELGSDTPPLTFFEFGTLVALWHFAREQVQLAVLETGLGGRLDATTAARPDVTAITPISFDHMDYLGNTLDQIAAEKAGILKPGVPAVFSRQEPEVLSVLSGRAIQVGAPAYQEGRDYEVTAQRDGHLVYRGVRTSVSDLALGLVGRHQTQNAAVALACLELLRDVGFSTSNAQLREGLREPRWPGRFEQIAWHRPLVLDGAHNPAGIEALVTALADFYPGHKIHLIFGVLRDKLWEGMISRLFPVCASVLLVDVPSPRSLHPSEYLARAKEVCPETSVASSPAEALAAAEAKAGSDAVLVGAGSLYLIGALKDAISKAILKPKGA